MGLIRVEPAAAERGKVDTSICGSGVGRVAACADPPRHCRMRATALGIWCQT